MQPSGISQSLEVTPRMAEPAFAHFELEPASPRAARRFVTATLEEWGCDEVVEVAVLLTGELVANVVLHADTGFDIVVLRPAGTVRIEVYDGSPRLPVRKHYSVSATTGRGLELVDHLARTSGAAPTVDGKVVWFELDDGPDDQATGATNVPRGAERERDREMFAGGPATALRSDEGTTAGSGGPRSLWADDLVFLL